MKKLILSFILAALFIGVPYAQATPIYEAHTNIQLIAEDKTLKPGSIVAIGLDMDMDENWHIYWISPGDSGMPPKVTWNLPKGFKTGALKFPFPHRLDYGDLTSYGHDGRVLLITDVQVPLDAPVGEVLTLKADVGWLTCDKICVPGNASLAINVMVSNDKPVKDSQWMQYFKDTRAQWPLKDHSIQTKILKSDNHFHIFIPSTAPIKDVEFFSLDEDVIQYFPSQQLVPMDQGFELIIEKSEFLDHEVGHMKGVLVAKQGWDGLSTQAIEISEDVNPLTDDSLMQLMPTTDMGMLGALLFAFIGGLILNTMPCVLPVLSLKVLGLIKHAQDRKRAWVQGVSFTLGVMVSFWILAGILIALKSTGHLLGWGFQFQSPEFIIVMVSVLFLMGLNLFGMFELGMGLTRIQTAHRSGILASFLSGFLATIVATPCTAPFMGAALTYALTQTIGDAFLIFTALGFGLACPYLLLTIFPSCLKFVPKPGPWMNKFKVSLGFLMMLTVLWLLWVLEAQIGTDFIRVGIALLSILVLAGWFLRLAQQKNMRKYTVIGVICIVTALLIGIYVQRTSNSVINNTSKNEAIVWQDFSVELVNELRAEGKTVFIDFTAKWCLSCQVNERFALYNDKVIRAFKDKNVVMVKADWTNRDDKITQALAQYGKESIPVYVLYSENAKQPIFLPEVLTPQIVLDVLNEIQNP
ncbi:MAG: thiol:disulfide interchange protein [Lysobacterales bacterium]|jgi:thiol:disulfide interchange protein